MVILKKNTPLVSPKWPVNSTRKSPPVYEDLSLHKLMCRQCAHTQTAVQTRVWQRGRLCNKAAHACVRVIWKRLAVIKDIWRDRWAPWESQTNWITVGITRVIFTFPRLSGRKVRKRANKGAWAARHAHTHAHCRMLSVHRLGNRSFFFIYVQKNNK